VPQVETTKSHPMKPAAVAVAALVLVGAIVAVVLIVKNATKSTADETKAVLTKAADKSFAGDQAAAIALLQDQLSRAKTSEEKVNLYLALGADYENKGDVKSALADYEKAAAINSSYGVNDAIARTAMAAGDKAKALDYYQRNRQLIKAGKANQHSGDLPTIEQQITQLGGTL
jgi:tetratricopeptide (TPR) repeat protein